jgi:hypothetical protein
VRFAGGLLSSAGSTLSVCLLHERLWLEVAALGVVQRTEAADAAADSWGVGAECLLGNGDGALVECRKSVMLIGVVATTFFTC